MYLIISLITFSLLVSCHAHVDGHEHSHPHTAPNNRMWPERWQSSWMFVRTDPAVIPNNTNELITAYGKFYYDWTQQRALFTHSRCPSPLPSETDFNDYPCDTLFLDSSIYLIAYNTSNDTKSCCKWYNPWNATVTSPDWMIRGDATYIGTSTRTGMKTKVWAGLLPFRWEYGILADPRTKQTVPHFLDLYDTPENQHIVTRWLTPDASIVDSFDESLFQLPHDVSCDSQCQMDVPFPVPAPDAVRYPHVAGVIPSTSAAVSTVEAMYAAQTPHAHLHAHSHGQGHGILHHASCPFAHQHNRVKHHKLKVHP